MTAKNRNKSGSSEKPPSPSPDDASKKSPKSSSSSSNGVSSSPGAQGPQTGGCLKTLMSLMFYVALVGAAGFAAFYVQQVVEDVNQMSAAQEERTRESAELRSTMEKVVQQVESLKSVVDGMESSLGVTRVELEGATARLKKGEVETRRVEEALQKLQNDLLRDLSDGINEVKEARERDFSSLETTVEDRLAELSQSIAASVKEFTEAQGEAQGQLADLKARMGDMEDPALIKQELAAIVETVADLSATKQAAEASADSLREQIASVGAELQTRNQEVASLSQEVEAVRTIVQETVGSLKQAVTAAEASVQDLKDRTLILEGGVEQATEAVHSVEKEVIAAADQAQKRSADLEARVKSSEDNEESLAASISHITSKVEALLAKYDSHESTLAAQGQSAEKARSVLEEALESLKSSLEEFQSNMAVLGGAQAKLVSKDSSLGQQVEELQNRLAALEDSIKGGSETGQQVEELQNRLAALETSINVGSETPKQLENLRSMVAGLEGKAAKLEGHEKAISALQKALKETTNSLAALSKAPGKQKK